MYSILRATVQSANATGRHPPRVTPELVATVPNQCWSWDVAKLHGPEKWTHYHLYA